MRSQRMFRTRTTLRYHLNGDVEIPCVSSLIYIFRILLVYIDEILKMVSKYYFLLTSLRIYMADDEYIIKGNVSIPHRK